MRRFEFRLEMVLKIKRQRERLAELKLQQARLAVDSAQKRRFDLLAGLNAIADEIDERFRQRQSVMDWLVHQERAARVMRLLELAEVDLQKAIDRVNAAAAARTKIATEVEALRYLRRHAWELHEEQEQASEQGRLDELSLRRWGAARNAKKGDTR